MSGKVLVYGRTSEAVVDSTDRFQVVEVIRASGMHEGERMAWGVLEVDPETLRVVDVTFYPTRREAKRAVPKD